MVGPGKLLILWSRKNLDRAQNWFQIFLPRAEPTGRVGDGSGQYSGCLRGLATYDEPSEAPELATRWTARAGAKAVARRPNCVQNGPPHSGGRIGIRRVL